MKRKLILFFLSVALFVQPAALIPAYTVEAAATTGASGKKLNLISAEQCLVIEPNYKAEDSQHLTPGSSFAKDPYIKSETNSDAYCFARIEMPTTTFTTVDETEVVGDAVKMLYGGKEGISTADWKVIKEIPSATPGTNSVYVVQYIGNSGVLKKQTSTGRIFDSMTMPSTVSVAGVSKQIASVDDVTGSVSVQGFLVASSNAKDSSDAYSKIKDELESAGNNSSNSSNYEDKLQRTIDTLKDNKKDLENQVKALEERLSTKLSTGDTKANQVIEGKIFSNADAVDLTGTMPNYDKGYYGAGNTSDTYSWTDLSGKVNTEKKEGYQAKIENGTGLTRNTDGTITISAGYHAKQVVQGASGNAQPSQVLSGVTYSNMTGPKTGTMANHGGYTAAYSWATSGGTTYIRFPYGAYLTSANNGLNQPEITIADTLHSNADYVNYGTSQYNSGHDSGKTTGYSSGYNDGKSASKVKVWAYGNIYGQTGDEHAGITIHLVVQVGDRVVYNNSASEFGNHGPSTGLAYGN